MNAATYTGKTFRFGGFVIPQVDVEPCYRLTQFGKGLPITCACSVCAAKNQTPEEALAAVKAAHRL